MRRLDSSFFLILFSAIFVCPIYSENSISDGNYGKERKDLFFDMRGLSKKDTLDSKRSGKLLGGARLTENQLGVEFNSSGARIERSDIFGLPWENKTSNVTIDFWIKPYEVSFDRSHFILGGNDYKNLSVELYSTHLKVMYGGVSFATSRFFFIPNVWVYVAISFDRNKLRIFINNCLDIETGISFPKQTEYFSRLTIGSRMHFVRYQNYEYIDDFRGVLASMRILPYRVELGEVISEFNRAEY